MSAEQGNANKQGACFHGSCGDKELLDVWPLLRSAVPLPQAGPGSVIQPKTPGARRLRRA